MKALRYILIVVSLLSFLNTNAQVSTQDWGKKPEAQMHSTSVMQGSGSTLPQAATEGTYVTGTTIGTYSPANTSGPKRAKQGDDDWEDDEFSETDEPWKDPLGDALLPLAVMACAYLLIRARRKRKSAMSK